MKFIKRIRFEKHPLPTVDIIIKTKGGGIILIQRRNPPFGWALPGGFVNYGESLEEAARREALEETSLALSNLQQFKTYSDPKRDPRFHTISTVYTATGRGKPRAKDDAFQVGIFKEEDLPRNIAFDHRQILRDYFKAARK